MFFYGIFHFEILGQLKTFERKILKFTWKIWKYTEDIQLGDILFYFFNRKKKNPNKVTLDSFYSTMDTYHIKNIKTINLSELNQISKFMLN